MYEILLDSALEKYNEDVERLARILRVNRNVEDIERGINNLAKKYADTQVYLLVNILRLYFDEEFDEIWKNSPKVLCFLIYKNKEKIESNFKKLKDKWEKAKREVEGSREKILSRELRELKFLLKLEDSEFKKLLTVFSLIGEIAGKVYNDLESIAEEKIKDWEELDVEKIEGIIDLSKEEKEKFLLKLLPIVLVGLIVVGGGFLLKKNFSNFFGQAEVRSIGNDTKSEGNNTESIQQETEKSKRIIKEKGERFLGTKNTRTSNSTLSTTENNNKTSINKTNTGKKEDGTYKVHPKIGTRRDKTTDKRDSKGNSKNTKAEKDKKKELVEKIIEEFVKKPIPRVRNS